MVNILNTYSTAVSLERPHTLENKLQQTKAAKNCKTLIVLYIHINKLKTSQRIVGNVFLMDEVNPIKLFYKTTGPTSQADFCKIIRIIVLKHNINPNERDFN